MYYSTDSVPYNSADYVITDSVNSKPQDEEVDLLDEVQKLALILDTPNLSSDNINVLNDLIQSLLLTLASCDCDDAYDFKDKSIEEMIEMVEG